MKRLTFLALALASLFAPLLHAADSDASPAYELRIYTCNEGKLEALLARFRDHTCKLFEKHGMKNIGYWVPVDEENGSKTTLIYVLEHKSREAAKESFKAFGADPEWQAARKASEEAGKILAKAPESIFMASTDYSPPLAIAKDAKTRVFEMRTYTTKDGKLDALHSRFRDHTVKLFSKHGMTNLAYWTPTDADKGAGKKLIYILAHDSKEAGQASFTAFRADPVWVKAKAASEAANNGSLTIEPPTEGVKSIYMKPTDFSPIQ
ncbi:NIPSNAP family protein [Prosthecobacter sp.]|uniref:NIPSNAP family protein n=1 Tax=Prosthecobacter sp. TaxID=1965333 RepID=UPI0024877BC2|nr:NIPSNAP family protein [Prosthecobacter sp.]MDI1313233.1 NIPSNAP family protein [Prosthecobacter sp.]